MNVVPANLEDCLQPNLKHPSVIHPKRMAFERDYQHKGFEYVMKKYGKDDWKKKVHKLFGRVKKKIKQTLGL